MQSLRNVALTLILSLVVTSAPHAGMTKAKSAGSIELINITPEAGSSVDRESVITAELRFTIDNFSSKKDRYQISISFLDRDSRGATFSEGPGDIIVLEAASGTVTMTYPLERVWDNPKLRKPIVLYFFLHERTGKHESIVLDSTDEIKFSVRDEEPPD